MFQMLGVFAESEREIIAERIHTGLAPAREQGTKSGKPIAAAWFNASACLGPDPTAATPLCFLNPLTRPPPFHVAVHQQFVSAMGGV